MKWSQTIFSCPIQHCYLMGYTHQNMTRESFILILGAIVAATPFLGIPGSWKQYILVASGVLIVIVSYQLRRAAFFRSIETSDGERRADAFVESKALEEHTAERSEEEHQNEANI